MSTILGQYIQEGKVAKIADDLYVGGDNIAEGFSTWAEILYKLHENGVHLNAPKTSIAPTSTDLLGWIWNNGTLTLGAHKISPLATCDPPATVTALRSFIGSYKVFNRVLRGCSQYMEGLESVIAGKQKRDKIIWSESLLQCFHKAQAALSRTATVTLACPDDQIIITHNGAKGQPGIGAVKYLVGNGKVKLCGFFSAKLKAYHTR